MIGLSGKPARRAGFFFLFFLAAGAVSARPLQIPVGISLLGGVGLGAGFGTGTGFVGDFVSETGSASSGVAEVFPWRASIIGDWFFLENFGCALELSAGSTSFAGNGLDAAGLVLERREYSYLSLDVSPLFRTRFRVGPGDIMADVGLFAGIPFLDGLATIRNSGLVSQRTIPILTLPAMPIGATLCAGYSFPLGPGAIEGRIRNELRYSTSFGNGTDQMETWIWSSTLMIGYSLRFNL